MQERMVPLQDAAERAGCTYRQASHWGQQGYLRLTWVSRVSKELAEGQGTGYLAMLTVEEYGVLHLMVRLVHCGFLPEAAAQAARWVAEYGAERMPLGQGFALEVVDLAGELVPEPPQVCGQAFQGQQLWCERLAGHVSAHRSGRLQWDDQGVFSYA